MLNNDKLIKSVIFNHIKHQILRKRLSNSILTGLYKRQMKKAIVKPDKCDKKCENGCAGNAKKESKKRRKR